MSRWFVQVRQDFILATLRQFGQIRRRDLVREFGVSVPQASNDIALFLQTHPNGAVYDVRTKCYVLEDQEGGS